MFLYLHLNSPTVIKLCYTDPETSQKGEENDEQNVSSSSWNCAL